MMVSAKGAVHTGMMHMNKTMHIQHQIRLVDHFHYLSVISSVYYGQNQVTTY